MICKRIASRANAIDLTDAATQSERLTVKVRYAALALYLGDASLASPMCALGPDPTERTAFTLRLKDWRDSDRRDTARARRNAP